MLIIMFYFHLFFMGFAFCLCFCDFPIGFQNCSDSVVFFCFSGRFWNCSDSMVFFVLLVDFRIVQTVWYFLFCWQILELFRQCGIFCFSGRFWNCSVWYFFVFAGRFQNCSDSVVFFVFLLDFGIVQTVWYLLSFISFISFILTYLIDWCKYNMEN